MGNFILVQNKDSKNCLIVYVLNIDSQTFIENTRPDLFAINCNNVKKKRKKKDARRNYRYK